MIELIKKDNSYAGSYKRKDELLANQVHIVCVAQNGLTHLNVYAELWCDIDKIIVSNACDKINSKKETGTLYPVANITILPKSEMNTDLNRHTSVLSFSQLQNCIKDVFVANSNYIKSEKIFFSLEPYYIDKKMAFEIINDLIINNEINDNFVKIIEISPF